MARDLRNLIVDGPDSLGQRARQRRWGEFAQHFPELGDMSVIDLGGTVEYWLRAPVRPRHVHVLNLERQSIEPMPDWLTVDEVDATMIPDGVLNRPYDLVYSNSVIEHVGGHAQRTTFAANVTKLAPNHWIQTPYRYFPVEPHCVCPMMQFLPLKARTWLVMRWPLVHTQPKGSEAAVEAMLNIELLDITQMRHYFPNSTLVYDRMMGMVKSVIAVKST